MIAILKLRTEFSHFYCEYRAELGLSVWMFCANYAKLLSLSLTAWSLWPKQSSCHNNNVSVCFFNVSSRRADSRENQDSFITLSALWTTRNTPMCFQWPVVQFQEALFVRQQLLDVTWIYLARGRCWPPMINHSVYACLYLTIKPQCTLYNAPYWLLYWWSGTFWH